MKNQVAWDALAWLEDRVRLLEDAAGQIRPRPEWSAADLQAYLIAAAINIDWRMDNRQLLAEYLFAGLVMDTDNATRCDGAQLAALDVVASIARPLMRDAAGRPVNVGDTLCWVGGPDCRLCFGTVTGYRYTEMNELAVWHLPDGNGLEVWAYQCDLRHMYGYPERPLPDEHAAIRENLLAMLPLRSHGAAMTRLILVLLLFPALAIDLAVALRDDAPWLFGVTPLIVALLEWRWEREETP